MKTSSTRVESGFAYSRSFFENLVDSALAHARKLGATDAGAEASEGCGLSVSVRKGEPKPDISSADALKKTLLDAKSIAYSASASGTYLSEELFPRLGVMDAIKDKAKRIESERVGTVVARGDAELGFQQVSELLPIEGLDFVGVLSDDVQKVTVFSAGLVVGSKEPEAAKELIDFLASKTAAPAIEKSGMTPILP